MAHNLNVTADGIASYRGRQAAWHGLGQVTGKYMSTDDLLKDPMLQYVVFKSQLRDGLGRPIDAWGTFRWDLKDKLAGNKEGAIFLGTIGENYSVIQHDEGFKTIDSLMRSTSGAHYETAGVLGKGETVWALADLGLSLNVGDDKSYAYLLFSTGHDGKMGHTYRLVLERVVCENTLGIALGERTKASLSIRHTKNAVSRLEDGRAMLANLGDDVKRVEDRMNFLAGRKMNRETMESVMNRLFPKRTTEDGEKDSTRRQNIISDILKIYELNDGNAFPEQRGTSFNLLNAITGYVDHERSSKGDNRAESAMFGSGDTLKSKALEIITEASKGLEIVSRPQYIAGSGTTGSAILDSAIEQSATVA